MKNTMIRSHEEAESEAVAKVQADYDAASAAYAQHVRDRHRCYESYCQTCVPLTNAIVQLAGDLANRVHGWSTFR